MLKTSPTLERINVVPSAIKKIGTKIIIATATPKLLSFTTLMVDAKSIIVIAIVIVEIILKTIDEIKNAFSFVFFNLSILFFFHKLGSLRKRNIFDKIIIL